MSKLNQVTDQFIKAINQIPKDKSRRLKQVRSLGRVSASLEVNANDEVIIQSNNTTKNLGAIVAFKKLNSEAKVNFIRESLRQLSAPTKVEAAQADEEAHSQTIEVPRDKTSVSSGRKLIRPNLNQTAIDLLIHNGEVNLPDKRGRTPVMLVQNGPDAALNTLKLIKAGADLTMQDKNGLGLIHHAVIAGNTDVIADVLPHYPNRVDTSQRTNQNRVAMHFVKTTEMAEALLHFEALKEGHDQQAKTGSKALTTRSNTQNVSKGLGLSTRNKLSASTPLMTALKAGRYDIAKLILSTLEGQRSCALTDHGENNAAHILVKQLPHIEVDRELALNLLGDILLDGHVHPDDENNKGETVWGLIQQHGVDAELESIGKLPEMPGRRYAEVSETEEEYA